MCDVSRNVALEEAIADLHVQVANQKATITARNETVQKLQDELGRQRKYNTAYARRLDDLLKAIADTALLARTPVI